MPNLVTPFGIYLLRQFFLTLPVELEEAAIIDGAGRLRILCSVLLPLMGPPLSTLAVLTFLQVWNDFLWPLVVTSSPEHDDRPARPRQLPGRPLHQLAGADGRHA